MIPFDEALEQCIEAVHSGASVADCVARYPHYADRLEPLLAVVAELYAAPLAVMSDTGFERQRMRLREQMRARGAALQNGASPNGAAYHGTSPNGTLIRGGAVNGKPIPPAGQPTQPGPSRPPSRIHPQRSRWPIWATSVSQRASLMATVLIIAVVTALGGVTLASAKAAPSEPLYTVKLVVENVVDWLPASPATQVERALGRAEERLTEGLTVCMTNPGQADRLLQQMIQQRERALTLLERVSGPQADTLRARTEALGDRAARFEQDCALVAPPTQSQSQAPAALPADTATVTPRPASPVTATAALAVLPTLTSTATRSVTEQTATGGSSDKVNTGAVSDTATSTLMPATGTPLAIASPAHTSAAAPQLSATPIPPTLVPATATPFPPTEVPATATQEPRQNPPTATPRPEPTAAPTQAPPTAAPPPTALIEPSRTPVPTDEPRPTEPPRPTQAPATPVPTVVVPPTPTQRVLEVTKVPTQPPEPTSRPLEATRTPNTPPGRPTPKLGG